MTSLLWWLADKAERAASRWQDHRERATARRQRRCDHDWVEIRGQSAAFNGYVLHVECAKCGVWTCPVCGDY